MSVTLRTLIVGSATFLLITCIAWGQASSATLTGTVTDPAGALIPGAEVSVESAATGLTRSTVTEDNGGYVFNYLPVGRYTVTVELPGFKTARQSVGLEIGQTRTLDVRLEVGELQELVEVFETAPALDRSSPELGTAISRSELDELPLNGRHWAALMLLAPGAHNTGRGDQSSIRFVGRANDDNNYTFDGVDTGGIKDPQQETSVRLIISMESVAEFRVSSSLYSAEHGNGMGGQIQLISKGGTNEFHGSLFEYHRNDAFDARVFTDPGELPEFRLNQFGGSIGGPIAQDKTFFFFSYEGLRQHQGQTHIDFVPSAEFRERVIATSPALADIVRAYPTGTLPTDHPDVDELVAARFLRAREDAFMVRFDHQFSEKTTFYGRFSIDDAFTESPEDAGIGLESVDFQPFNLALQLQRVFTPTVINEFKVGMNRAPVVEIVTGPLDFEVGVPGFMDLVGSPQDVEAGTSVALVDNLAVTRGRHNLKVGGEVRRIHVNFGQGEPLAIEFGSREDLVNNRLDGFSIEANPIRGGRRWHMFGYIQDDFKWRPNLTLNLGLRYENYTVPVEVLGRDRVFRMECGGICAPGTPWFSADNNNFDPRLGLAWAPAAFNNKTVIRAGAGIYHGPGQFDDVLGPMESSALRIDLSSADAPGLSFPIEPWLPLAAAVADSPRAVAADHRDMYTINFGLSVQQELPSSLVMQVGYIGGVGHKLLDRVFVNNIDPLTGERPLTEFGRVDLKGSGSNSNFHGLQVSLHRQLVDGFSLGTQYIWSHSINEGSTGGGESQQINNANCRSCERGNSNFDIRHSLTTNWIFELPFGPGRRFLDSDSVAGKLLGGWELSGITQARTGRPVLIQISRKAKDMLDGNNGGPQRPDRVPGVPIIPPGGQTAGQWINPEAFARPAPGTWGNLGRNVITGPAMIQFDVGLTRKFALSEHRSIQVRAEAFNIFNRAPLGQPIANLANVNFGRIVAPFNRTYGTGTNRQMQFMLRFNF